MIWGIVRVLLTFTCFTTSPQPNVSILYKSAMYMTFIELYILLLSLPYFKNSILFHVYEFCHYCISNYIYFSVIAVVCPSSAYGSLEVIVV